MSAVCVGIIEFPTCDTSKPSPFAVWTVSFVRYVVDDDKLFKSAVIWFVAPVSAIHTGAEF